MRLITIKQFLRYLLFVPFILVLCTVFANSNQLANGIVTAKYFWFFACMALLLPVIPFLKPIKSFQLADLLLLLAIGSIFLSAFASGTPYAKTKLILLLLLYVFYYQLRSFLITFRSAEFWITFVLIGTSFVECVIGLRQLYGFTPSHHGLFKITGTFFNPGPFSGYVGMIFPFAFYHSLIFAKTKIQLRSLISKKSNANNWMSYLFGSLSVATVFASLLVLPAAMSRASWVGLVVGSLCVLNFYLPTRVFVKRNLNTKKKSISILALMVLLLTGSSVGLYALRPASVDGRMLLWKNALNTMIHHPFGVGLGKFGSAVGETQAAYFASAKATQSEIDRADVPFYAFNEYLQIGVESGVFTLALFLGFTLLTLKNAYRDGRHGLIGSVVSILFFAFFSYPFSVLPILVVFIFLMALCNTTKISATVAVISETKSKTFSKTLFCKIPTALLAFTYLALITFSVADRFKTYKALRTWNSCKILLNVKLYSDAAEELKPLYLLLSDNQEYLFEYARALSGSGHFKESNQVLSQSMTFSGEPMLYNIRGKNCQALKEYDEAEIAFVKAYNMIPNRIYPLYLLGRIYAEKGEVTRLNQVAKRIENHKIIIPSKAIEEMKDSLNLMLGLNTQTSLK